MDYSSSFSSLVDPKVAVGNSHVYTEHDKGALSPKTEEKTFVDLT